MYSDVSVTFTVRDSGCGKLNYMCKMRNQRRRLILAEKNVQEVVEGEREVNGDIK